jgi:hypothetical protein
MSSSCHQNWCLRSLLWCHPSHDRHDCRRSDVRVKGNREDLEIGQVRWLEKRYTARISCPISYPRKSLSWLNWSVSPTSLSRHPPHVETPHSHMYTDPWFFFTTTPLPLRQQILRNLFLVVMIVLFLLHVSDLNAHLVVRTGLTFWIVPFWMFTVEVTVLRTGYLWLRLGGWGKEQERYEVVGQLSDYWMTCFRKLSDEIWLSKSQYTS